MAIKSKVILKTYFDAGDKPTSDQFDNLIDSLAHVEDDSIVKDSTASTGFTNGFLLKKNNDGTIGEVDPGVITPTIIAHNTTPASNFNNGFLLINNNGVVGQVNPATKQDALGFTPEDIANKQTDLTASATKYPTVDAVNTGLDLKPDKLLLFNRQTVSYTLVLADKDKMVEMNLDGANNLTIPNNSSVAFGIGTQILVSQYGAGQTTFVPASGVTLRSDGGKIKLTVQYSLATLIKIAVNEWYLSGSIST